MDISVVLATYKRQDILHKTLSSFVFLTAIHLEWQLFVVDNADDQETKKVVDTFSDKLAIKYLVEPNPGKNNALNSALPHMQGNLFVFTDDDILPNSDWLEQLWEGAQCWPDNKVFGGRIIADWPNGIPFWGDSHPLNQSLFSLHSPSKEERPYGEGDFLPYGPNMAVRREIFDQGYQFNPNIGPTNSTIYRMGSETEFLQRLKDDGYTPVFLPKAMVKHQIRLEQLTPVGLNRRNFRIGLSDITPDDSRPKQLFGCAPYLWKQLVITQATRLKDVAKGDRISAFENTCRTWRLRGKIYAQRHYNGAIENSLLQKLLEVK